MTRVHIGEWGPFTSQAGTIPAKQWIPLIVLPLIMSLNTIYKHLFLMNHPSQGLWLLSFCSDLILAPCNVPGCLSSIMSKLLPSSWPFWYPSPWNCTSAITRASNMSWLPALAAASPSPLHGLSCPLLKPQTRDARAHNHSFWGVQVPLLHSYCFNHHY